MHPEQKKLIYNIFCLILFLVMAVYLSSIFPDFPFEDKITYIWLMFFSVIPIVFTKGGDNFLHAF
jgi:lipopolysaccharide export LptBFGC system permease protein LptF